MPEMAPSNAALHSDVAKKRRAGELEAMRPSRREVADGTPINGARLTSSCPALHTAQLSFERCRSTRATVGCSTMTDVRRAAPAARRQAVLFLVVGTFVGALLIVAFERYRIPLSNWVLAQGASAQRVKLVFLLLVALLLAPLLAFAAYLWSLGGRVLRAREFPPPGLRVFRNTPVITGGAAISRRRQLEVVALGRGIASVALGLLLWRLASLFSGHAA